MQVIAHNIMSQFTSRQLKITGDNKNKSTEKLSSGYRINRAGDDAAGLSISEKMRWQIRGLNKCDGNIQDGISLLQVADGAMGEIDDILHRLKELSIQGMNDTNTDEDVEAIQKEMDQMVSEIDSIAEKTTFNGVRLLQGEFLKTTQKTVTNTVEEMVVNTIDYQNKRLPDWVKVNGVNIGNATANDWLMRENNNNMDLNTTVQNTNLIKYVSDPANPYAAPQEITGWSTRLNNNMTAVLDFSALSDTGISTMQVDDDVNGDGVIDSSDTINVNNVYTKLNDLVNTGFSMGCRTCNDRYGIILTTREAEKKIANIVDPTNPEEEKLKKQMYGYPTDHDYERVYIDDLLEKAMAPSGASQAGNIAKELVQRIYQTGESAMNHFTHYTIDGSNPTKLVVYDFRDVLPTDDPNEYSTRALINSDFILREITQVTIPEHTDSYTYNEVQEGLMIQSGEDAYEAIPLHLYDATAGKGGLNLRDNAELQKKQYMYTTSTSTTHIQNTMRVPKYNTQSIPGYYKSTGEHVPAKTIKTIAGYDTVNIEYDVTNHTRTLAGVSQYKNGKVIDNIDRAVDYLNNVRAQIGAQQNRLEHAKAVDNNTEENTQAAESRLRDTDYAEEIVNHSKHSILEQAGQSMLAQANQQPQGILNLLQ